MMKTRLMLGWMLAAAAGLGSARADVKMPEIFGDHMVLQQDTKLPVWGKADPGEKVKVTLGDKSAEATTGGDGKWRVELPTFPVNSKPVTMAITGKNTLTFNDVLVGDVWLCSGQSNMERSFGISHNTATERPKANDQELRLFLVARPSLNAPPLPGDNAWVVCTPETVSRFSAVGYFFGRELRANLQRPIGLIGAYVGGTPVEAWTGPSVLPEKLTADQKAAYDKQMADYAVAEAAYKTDLTKWNQDVGIAFADTMKVWNAAVAKARQEGQSPPPRPQPSTPPPRSPPDPMGAGGLFHSYVLPLVPYAIKGVIWYQGEANTGHAQEYQAKFAKLINSWRGIWNEGDFPFLFVQLAAYEGKADQDWALLREAQLKTLGLPNTGMATAVDIGDAKNVHPTDKMDVGQRLALAARHVAYGQQLVYSGPIYDSMKVEGGTIRVSFTQVGGGLIIGAAPWVTNGATPLPTDHLMGFSIAGADQNWVPAEAKIDGNTVIVSSAQVPQPVAVRYGWLNVPQLNLYNKENLPASPFRTDDWPSKNGGPASTEAPAPAPPAVTSTTSK